jgi:outer membrane PBP1 activator LpoA protein
MQRVILLISALVALYVSGFACASTEPLAPGDEKPAPHIALILPLKSSLFSAAASAVQQGFNAAASISTKTLPVRVYGCFDESKDIVEIYRLAIGNGAKAVVGPLTRSGVSTLAAEKNIPVPTLMLNVTEETAAPHAYFFGMAAEAEARRVAQLAAEKGLHQAIVIAARTPLDKRMQFAFEEEWNASGRGVLREIEFDDDPTPLYDLATLSDTAIFIAADADQARLIRPYLPNKMPIFATSQIFIGNDDALTNNDLNDIRFVDMPWLLQVDHPAVMSYPRAAPPLSANLERLYALGIDAFRLTQVLLANRVEVSMPLDGVTGHIELSRNTFLRTAIPAVFVQGKAQLPDAVPTTAVQLFPDQFVNKTPSPSKP